MSNKSIRIRTKPGGDDKYIRVKLDQDFNQLQILSLNIDQEDVYRSFCSNYGVVAGRIDINNGFGLKNTKVSIFIPLSSEDQENELISQLYPFKTTEDLTSNGVRYNLLPRKQQHIDHTPTGTFPDKRQILDNPTMVEVYDKYYKYTTTTNEAGDYMFFGVPVGNQEIFIDIDVSDIGFLSVRPYEMIAQGVSEEKFESKFKFKSSAKLDDLPQIISTSTSVEVLPFWCDDISFGSEVGITRFDYSVIEYELTPTAIFMGSIFTDNENNSLSKNCRPRKKMGRMNDLTTGTGKIEAMTRTKDGEIVLSKDIPEDSIDENGNWSIQLPMNLRKLITDEFGSLVPSPDGDRGVASEADYRFRVSFTMGSDEKKFTRAKMLVPNMTNNYKFGEFTPTDLSNAEEAEEPIFKINDQLSYDVTNGPLNQYNYLEDFYTFRWKKIYTVRQYIPRYQPNKNDKNKNFIGFKEILDGDGVNKLPYNRLFTKIHILYTIVCFILKIFGFIVAFVNGIIQFINALISRICQIRIPFPCLYLDIVTGSGGATQSSESDQEDTSPSVQKRASFRTVTIMSVYNNLYDCKVGNTVGDSTDFNVYTAWPCNDGTHQMVSTLFNRFYWGYDTNFYQKPIGDSGITLLMSPVGPTQATTSNYCYSGGQLNTAFSQLQGLYGGDNSWNLKSPNINPYFKTNHIADGFSNPYYYRFSNIQYDNVLVDGTWQECASDGLSESDFDSGGCASCKDLKYKYNSSINCDESYRGIKFKILKKCFRVCFFLKIKIKQICILKGLCDSCSNDDGYPSDDDTNGSGVNQDCCNGCKDCGGGCPEGDSCPENCLKDCCEKIRPITLSCAEEGKEWTPVLWETKFEGDGNQRKCGGDKLETCFSCSGRHNYPIDNWVACKLEQLASFLGMLDFEFYNDWMNGSLYFPLIKRNLKIKRAKKAAKGKSLKRGQGQIKKDVFCDYDCDGGKDEPDYQYPDEVNLYSVKIVKNGKQDLIFNGCKVEIPRRKVAKQWYDTKEKVFKTIKFNGTDITNSSKGCSFTMDDYCKVNSCNDGDTIVGTTKEIVIKTKKVPGEHGKPKYIKIGAGVNGDGKDISIWENVGGHGHQRNQCKRNYFIEREEYTKDNLSDCKAISQNEFIFEGDDGFKLNTDDELKDNNDEKDNCDLACQGQGSAACSKTCPCNEKYNEDPNYRGVIKWEEGELYYVSIKTNEDKDQDKSEDSNTGYGGGGNFDSKYYKKNMFFPTNITELGSSVFCDIDEAPFIMDQLEVTSYKVSEEELSVSNKKKNIPSGVNVDYVLKEKESNVNLRAYVDFGCTGVRCMNVRASLTEAQVGTELYDLNDTSLECDSCTAFVDVDTSLRQYFCQRFSTFIPDTNGNTITNMKVNYMRPGGSQGENYYEPYNDVIGSCGSFSNNTALIDGGTTNDDVIIIDNQINDNDPITPGDKCGYWSDGQLSSLNNVKYFYGMDLSKDHTKNNLGDFPYSDSMLNMGRSTTNDIITDDDDGITPFTTQTPYFFYFGLIPNKTAVNKTVAKFFADKIDSQTLKSISSGDKDSGQINYTNSTKSPQSIIGSCVKN